MSKSVTTSICTPTERALASLLVAAALLSGAAEAREFSGLAFINDDATLSIRQRRVELWGIHIPRTAEDCQTFVRPIECGQRAALALKLRAEGFIHCENLGKRADGITEATCRVDAEGYPDGLDLAAHLLEYGWAVALPDAPFEYHVLERIARQTGRGLWGIPGVMTPLVAPGAVTQ